MEDRGEETEERERERPSPSLPPPLQSQFAEILNFRGAGGRGRAGGREGAAANKTRDRRRGGRGRRSRDP